MYCTTCGYPIGDNHKFCANCGIGRLDNDQRTEIQVNDKNADSIEIFDNIENVENFDNLNSLDNLYEENTLRENIPLPDFPPEVREPSPPQELYQPQPQEFVRISGIYGQHEEPGKPEKYFFGKKAFVLCLSLIGILSATAVMFATLYFSEIGAL